MQVSGFVERPCVVDSMLFVFLLFVNGPRRMLQDRRLFIHVKGDKLLVVIYGSAVTVYGKRDEREGERRDSGFVRGPCETHTLLMVA